MRGRVESQGEVFHTVHVEGLVPAGHPLRAISNGPMPSCARHVAVVATRLRHGPPASYHPSG